MNYILHLNHVFSKLSQEAAFTSRHISLYMALFHSWNMHKFSKALPVFRSELMQAAKIGNKTTYTHCLYELEAEGYLHYQPASSPYQPSLVFMQDFSAITGSKALQSKSGEGSPIKSGKGTEKGSENDTEKVTGNDSEKGIENKHEKNSPMKPAIEKSHRESLEIKNNLSLFCSPTPLSIFTSVSFCLFQARSTPTLFLTTIPSTIPKNGHDSENGTGKVLLNNTNTINFQTNNIYKQKQIQEKDNLQEETHAAVPSTQTHLFQKSNAIQKSDYFQKSNELKPASLLAELSEEKEKVAEKRKRNPVAIPFSESVYANRDIFVKAFAGTEFEQANLLYYHAALANWRDKTTGEPPLRKDWIALARTFMLNDIKAGKLVLYNHPIAHVKPNPTHYSGNSIDLPALFRLIDERHP